MSEADPPVERRIDFATLRDTGVAVEICFATTPILPSEVEAFFGFVHRTLEAQLEAWENEHGRSGLVPVLNISAGSIKCVVRFMHERLLDGIEFAHDVARDVAKTLASNLIGGVLAAALSLGFAHNHVGQPPPEEPSIQIIQAVDQVVSILSQS